jgi:hypothetical protein
MSQKASLAQLISELELAHLAHKVKDKNTVHRDYNNNSTTKKKYAYLK